MAEFVEIKHRAFNADHVLTVEFLSSAVRVNFINGEEVVFIYEEREAFRKWWERSARVYKAL